MRKRCQLINVDVDVDALLFTISVWILLSRANHSLKMQETGPTVYSPYPRRPDRLTN